jgi:hypothetical protein
MAKKLPMSPDVSYMLGIYRCNSSHRNVCLKTASKELVERFVKIAAMKLGTSVDAIIITNEGDLTTVELKNSRLKTLLDKALDERERIFKYKNEYSASYFAAMFDCNGAADNRGIFVRGMNAYDKILLERIGFHTATNTGRCYIKKEMDFMMFIAPFSIKAKLIRQPTKKQPTNKSS